MLFYWLQVLTFLIDSSRFRYPERAIVFLAVCYLVVGCAYVAGLGAGDSVSCREPFPPPVKLGRLQMMSTITQVSVEQVKWILFFINQLPSICLSPWQGHRQTTSCTVLFMALYFCCMAAFAWWSCLAFAWFLAAGLKWGHEAIENKSHLFHLVAWAVPALQTISVLALAKVEGKCVIQWLINNLIRQEGGRETATVTGRRVGEQHWTLTCVVHLRHIINYQHLIDTQTNQAQRQCGLGFSHSNNSGSRQCSSCKTKPSLDIILWH